MKLAICAMLPLIAIIIGCHQEQVRYVNVPPGEHGRGASPLWHSEQAWTQCMEDSKKRDLKSPDTTQPPSCSEGQIGLLIHGTKVALIGECGNNLSKVRVVADKLAGKTGCIAPSLLALGVNP